MFQVLIDTSVWLDLAQDRKQASLIDPLEAMIKQGRLVLLVPRIVVTEFQKNRGRVAERAQKGLSSQFNQVKEAIRNTEGSGKRKEQVLEYLSDVSHKIPLLGGMATSSLDRIETLLSAVPPIETTDEIKVRASDRALSGKAPCHHENKNSMADAVLIETYFDALSGAKAGDRFAFVTHNKHDFSDMSRNQKNPHSDLANGFSKIKSLYCVTLGDCLRRIDPAMVQVAIWENSYEPPLRSLAEVLAAIDLLRDQVWYNHHKNHAWKIAHGKAKVVTRGEWERGYKAKGWRYNQTHTIDTVWESAITAAKAKEREYGKRTLGPWSDFEWGMINGKLSALRWSLGDEWDMLDI